MAVANLLDVLPEKPALVVIEAPMGEGKTEAALSCATGSRGIYVAMPTQATSNALFPRLAPFLEGQTQQAATFPIALAHGSGGTFSPHTRGWPALQQHLGSELLTFSPHTRGWPGSA